MTFSIVARADDGPTGEPEWGVAVASKFLAVGAAVPAAVAGIGAIATQSFANVTYKPIGLSLLDEGATAQVALDRLVEDDDERDVRQAGIVDAEGNAATFTGPGCYDWAGGLTGEGFAVQGNILAGPEVVEEMRLAFESSTGQPLASRLLAALAAGDGAGGDARGRQSAALLVVREGAGYGGLDDVAVDLRVDDHPEPIPELARLLGLHQLYLTASREDEKEAITPELATELLDRSRDLGYDSFVAWVGAANLEMRVDEGDQPQWVDRVVLDLLREAR